MAAKAKIPPALWIMFIVVDVCIVGAVLIALFWVAPVPTAFAGSQTLAQASSAKPGGLSVVIVTADYCYLCQMYKRGALADARVEQWIEQHAGAVALKWGRDTEAIESIPVEGFPATVVMTGSHVLATHIGVMDTDELLEFLETARKRVETGEEQALPEEVPVTDSQGS